MTESPKLCNACGEKVNARRAPRWLKVVGLALLAFVAFAFGRYGTPPRTVYLLGTPVEPLAASAPRVDSEAVGQADETVSICGAPTKSGKPCQRKVKGGGYCYQHRDKYGQKNASRQSQ